MLSEFLCTDDFVLMSETIEGHIGLVVRMSILDTKGRWFEPQHQYVFSLSKRLYRIASVDSAVK